MPRPTVALVLAAFVALPGTVRSEEISKGRLWMTPQEDRDIARAMGFLFPETKGWTVYRDLPQAKPGDVDNGEAFRDARAEPAAMAKDGTHRMLAPDGSRCTVALRLFSGHLAHERFRRADLWPGTPPAVVYSGSETCSEATMTLVWRLSVTGYPESVHGEYGELVSVKPGLGPKDAAAMTTWHNVGGGSTIGHYTLTEHYGRPATTIDANGGLTIPRNVREARRDVILKEERVLQASPGPLDMAEYRQGMGDDRMYLDLAPAGTKVEQRLLHRDAEGQEWRLVIAPWDVLDTRGGHHKGQAAGWIKVLPRQDADAPKR